MHRLTSAYTLTPAPDMRLTTVCLANIFTRPPDRSFAEDADAEDGCQLSQEQACSARLQAMGQHAMVEKLQ